MTTAVMERVAAGLGTYWTDGKRLVRVEAIGDGFVVVEDCMRWTLAAPTWERAYVISEIPDSLLRENWQPVESGGDDG